MKNIIYDCINASIQAKQRLLDCPETIANIEKAAIKIKASFENGGKFIACGNGGSAADAQHMAAEFVARFKKERKALPAIALTTNTSTITALANDYNYDIVFKRQVEAFAKETDVLLAISTSGKAANVIEALRKAKEMGCFTIALTGKDGGQLSKEADLSIIAKDDITACIQETHIMIIHILCELVDMDY